MLWLLCHGACDSRSSELQGKGLRSHRRAPAVADCGICRLCRRGAHTATSTVPAKAAAFRTMVRASVTQAAATAKDPVQCGLGGFHFIMHEGSGRRSAHVVKHPAMVAISAIDPSSLDDPTMHVGTSQQSAEKLPKPNEHVIDQPSVAWCLAVPSLECDSLCTHMRGPRRKTAHEL